MNWSGDAATKAPRASRSTPPCHWRTKSRKTSGSATAASAGPDSASAAVTIHLASLSPTTVLGSSRAPVLV
ncbi:hypothetical protein ABZ464_39795 [Streptomyces sp. NPDC005820]|uniref:hypothetical protein n=1 Tax=Streptomyces sp. NPDC005820 TaxID=3157069 RepID=UPI0033FAEE26